MLIVFEGLDAVGKTTQITRVEKYLNYKSISTSYQHQPRSSSIGKDVYEILVKNKGKLNHYTEWLLHCASHFQHWQETLLAECSNDKIVVLMDRWWWSAVAYSVFGKGLSKDIVEQLEKLASRDFIPDLVFYFYNDKPFKQDDELQNNQDDAYRNLVNAGYSNLCSQNKNSYPIVKIDVTNKEEDSVFEIVKESIEKFVLSKYQSAIK